MCTHLKEVSLSFGLEVPFDGSETLHFAPSLAGDAAQFEAHARHCLCVRVHLCTGPMTLVHC